MNITTVSKSIQAFNCLLFLISLIMYQCARVTSPTGGPKDEIPPVMVSSDPGSNTTNFKGKEITLIFSEDIQVKNAKEEILSTPPLGEKTTFVAKKKLLIVKPELDLLPNTTYSINFRGAVGDLNESLPAENLRLAFSTGPEIDSLKINGQIYYLLEDRKAENITVAVYASDTFNIFKHKPLYFTKTDKKGRYSLQNLKSDNYYVYAFDDKNKNLKVDSKAEFFDFTPKAFSLKKDTTVFLSLFTVNASLPKVSAVRNYKNLSTVAFNKPLDSIKPKLLANNPVLITYADTKNEVIIYHDEIQDSIRFNLQAIDSLNQKMDTTVYIKGREGIAPKSKFKIKLLTNYSYPNNTVSYTIDYNKPIKKYVPDSCYVGIDSTFYTQINITDLTFDTLYHRLNGSMKLPEPEKPVKQKEDTKKDLGKKETKPLNPKVTISFKKGAFISLDNDSSSVATNEIKILTEEECGSLKTEVETPAKNYILYLIKDKKIIATTNTSPYTFTKLEPGTYRLQLLIDDNNDKKWNPGNFAEHTKAERVILFKEEDISDITIRANWECGPMKVSSEVTHTIEVDNVENNEDNEKFPNN